MMKFVSWNVNGLRAALGKGFTASVGTLDADAVCLQETRMLRGQAEVELPGYEEYWNSAEKKGYSGTAVFTRVPAASCAYDIGIAEHDTEGRVIAVEYESLYLVNVYTPNAQHGLTRLDYRMRWEDDFRAYLLALDARKPVIVCGDLNVAHQEIDLKNPGTNRQNPGFTDAERGKLTALLDAGFVDTYRARYPDREGAYTWWSFRGNARANNTGWRIDYFLVSQRLAPQIAEAAIHPDITGSDHCPVSLTLDV